MIYFCADDYGLDSVSSANILKCIDEGPLNKVSVFPNFEKIDFEMLRKDIRISLHLNLVEGKCMAEDIPLIADEKGNLKNAFSGLFKLSIINRREFEKQIYKEIKAQVLYWKNILPEGIPFCIDSHQHTHTIPSVFKTLIKVLKEEEINPEYMRIPVEPLTPFIKTPSLYLTYSMVNIIKQWLLNILWLINKRYTEISPSYFFGILFSGKMDEKRVAKILPKFAELAEKKGKDIEVLFHPGYFDKKIDLKVKFSKFYLSQNRKTEFDSVMKIAEGSVR